MKLIMCAALASVLFGVELAAQKPCSGPGAVFGVTSYRCVSCSIQRSGTSTTFIFDAEPIVLQASERSVLRSGDVIIAVNGHPITTRAGADAFTYPTDTTEILARRGGEQLKLSAVPFTSCPDAPASLSGTRFTRFNILADTMLVQIDSSRTPGSNDQTGRFGFALECVPSCTRTRASDGTEYWKFNGLPRVAIVEEHGPAFREDIVEGDLVLEVNAKSVLDEAGALALVKSGTSRTLTLKVRRPDRTTREATLRFERGVDDVRACGKREVYVTNYTKAPVQVFAGQRLIGSAGPGRTTFQLPPGVREGIEIRDRGGDYLAGTSGRQPNRATVAFSVRCR